MTDKNGQITPSHSFKWFSVGNGHGLTSLHELEALGIHGYSRMTELQSHATLCCKHLQIS